MGVGYKVNGHTPSDLAIAADRNDGEQLLTVVSNAPSSDQRRVNSRNHDGDGQNVLYNDGHVDFALTSWVGANRDCIYSIAKVTTTAPQQQLDPAASSAWPKLTDAQPNLDMDTVLIPAKGAGYP